MQTSCQLGIDDLGDNNPFTYRFAAVDANNIIGFSWDLGDGTTASGPSIDHTYTATGSRTIRLDCTPDAGYGSPITL